MRHLIAVVAVSFAAALFCVPASPALAPTHVSAADCYWCLPGTGPAPAEIPPPTPEPPPVGGQDGCTIGADCDYVPGVGVGPNDGVFTPCPFLEGEVCSGDQGTGEDAICFPYCVVYNSPNDPAPVDDPPIEQPPVDESPPTDNGCDPYYGCGGFCPHTVGVAAKADE